MGCDIRLRVVEDAPVRLRVLETIVIRNGALPDYEGPYQVTPTVDGLTLETSERALHADVDVLEIPYILADNESGGKTASIAS